MVRTAAFLFVVTIFGLPAAAGEAEYEHDAIGYSAETPDNPVARLQRRLEAGEVTLPSEGVTGRLRSLLRELDVDERSQALVFSKTSLQRTRISPETPRAIYFNDDTYVGYCRGGDVIEVSTADPQLGAVFYTMNGRDSEPPTLVRQADNCLVCHASSVNTGGVPGHVVRSVFADAAGFPVLSAGSFRTDQNSPLEERWGGWYVSGTHGDAKHLGNLIVRDQKRPAANPPENLNVTDLESRFDAAAYLTPHSDVVALMVLEHQTGMHNRLAAASFAARRALWDEKVLDDAFGDGAETLRESTVRRINNAAESVVEHLLFSGEAKLSGRMAGTSGFAEGFAAKGPRDSKGRSLRDFDLETRLFRHPCSYLIYSAAFDALPEPVQARVYARLHEVLTNRDAGAKYAHLTPADRAAILEILLDTKPGLPESWRGPNAGVARVSR